jgi:hypothetical protein
MRADFKVSEICIRAAITEGNMGATIMECLGTFYVKGVPAQECVRHMVVMKLSKQQSELLKLIIDQTEEIKEG